MSSPLIVINVVGLSPYMVGDNTPNITKLLRQGYCKKPLAAEFPAVTTTAQSAMVTGKQACDHGIVGNGWYFHELAEVGFWKQANQIVQSEKVWDVLKAQNPALKVSKLFWWYNMYANVDSSITPRPHYLADGGKVFDLYSSPQGLHEQIETEIGTFPFFNFWGPKAGIGASQWIAKAAIKEFELNKPDLQLVYLPHLDYCLQKLGPNDPLIAHEVQAIDAVVGDIIKAHENTGAEFLLVSEYGITEVNKTVHINKVLRQQGYITVRKTLDFENLDCGASTAFAVADHQCAHVYVNDKSKLTEIKQLLINTDGIERVLDKEEQVELGIHHQRSGDLVAISHADAWFSYYYWLDDKYAPDFARTVDIHRKVGYDPVEMFVDPKIKFPLLAIAGRVLKKKLGFRYLMDVIPLDTSLIKGCHGRLTDSPEQGPILIAKEQAIQVDKSYQQTDIFDLILKHFTQ
jgi:predicted AlkP superfamily pyrophosphatase or phosphodiesterase